MVRLLSPFSPDVPGPQSGGEKFREYLQSMFGVVPLSTNAATAAIAFGLDSPTEWEQDAAGYGRRLGNNVGYNVARHSIAYPAALLLREDNRYFQSGKSGAGKRVLFAVSSPFRARRPGGRYFFSFSTTGGIVGGNLVAQTWAPPSWQGPGRVMRGVGLSYAGIAGLNVFREFVPDLMRRLSR